MIISYNKLLKKLIDRNMTRRDLIGFAGVTGNVCASILKQEAIPMSAAIKICSAFKCNIGDIMDFSFEDEEPLRNEDTLPGSATDYIYDIDPESGFTRIYREIPDQNNPTGRPLYAFVKRVSTDKISEEMFPDDKLAYYKTPNLEHTIIRRMRRVSGNDSKENTDQNTEK